MLKITNLVYKITAEHKTANHQFRVESESTKDELLSVGINVFTTGDNPEYVGSVSCQNGQISSSFMSNNFDSSVFTDAINIIEELKKIPVAD